MISIPPSQSKQRYPVVIDTVRKKKNCIARRRQFLKTYSSQEQLMNTEKVLKTMRACLDEWCNDERFTIRHLKSLHQREGALEREIRACASEWRRTPSVIHRILLLLHRTMLSLSWKPAEDDTSKLQRRNPFWRLKRYQRAIDWSILGRARIITAKFFTAYEIVGAGCLLAAPLWEAYKALKVNINGNPRSRLSCQITYRQRCSSHGPIWRLISVHC